MEDLKIKAFLLFFVFFISNTCFAVSQNFDWRKAFNSATELKNHKKLALGLSLAGASGLVALQGEFQISPENSVLGSLGVASDFQTIHIKVKKTFIAKKALLPYASVGFARWISSSTDFYSLQPSNEAWAHALGLTNKKNFSNHSSFLSSSLGLEMIALDNFFKGTSVFVEFVILININHFASLTTGGLGMMYHF